MGTRNQLFQSLKSKGKIVDRQLEYFMYEYKKVVNLEKLNLLPKINKQLLSYSNVLPCEKVNRFI